jgi:hypothetical protein
MKVVFEDQEVCKVNTLKNVVLWVTVYEELLRKFIYNC